MDHFAIIFATEGLLLKVALTNIEKFFYRGLDRNLIIMDPWEHFHMSWEFAEQHIYH